MIHRVCIVQKNTHTQNKHLRGTGKSEYIYKSWSKSIVALSLHSGPSESILMAVVVNGHACFVLNKPVPALIKNSESSITYELIQILINKNKKIIKK